MCFATRLRNEFTIERPARGEKRICSGRSKSRRSQTAATKQEPSPSGKSENEGIQRIPSRTSGWAGLILLFAEKCPGTSRSRRAQPNRYPDFGLQTSFPPSHPLMALAGQWLLGIRIPLQWRYRPRFSRGSLHLTAMIGGPTPAAFKERFVVTPRAPDCQAESWIYFGRAAGGRFRLYLAAKNRVVQILWCTHD